MSNREYSNEFICTHLGEENAPGLNYGAVVPPIFATSLHVFDSIEGLLGFDADNTGGKYIYGRVDNPNTHLLEQKLAALERADGALCFASGMAAITASILHCVKPGDNIVTVKNVYGPARTFMEGYLKAFGVSVTFISGSDASEFEQCAAANTKLFYLESPSSLVMELQDLKSIVKLARARGIKTVIDNTWATPLHQRPLELGVDISLHTMSKYIGGHSDIIGGILCAGADIIRDIKNNERELIGGILGPFEAWLATRGLRTLPVRLERSGGNALAVARLLEQNPRVRRVNYPALESHPQHSLFLEQMSGGSGLLSFELDGTPEQAVVVANRLKLFHKGVSWGGFESLACMPMYKLDESEARNRNSSRNLIRLYCGLENQADMLADLDEALASI